MPWLVVLLAAALGLVAGSYPIANTSIGWHLASGHWIVENSAVPRTDPFSFTSGAAPWIDHEWLFQVAVALTERAGGEPALVLIRAVMVAGLAVLLLFFGMRSGLSPPAALVLATLCLYGARIRFFLRPELVTLLIAPAVVWIFIRRLEVGRRRWPIWIALLMVIGANFHGGVLIVPPLLAGILTADWLQWLATRNGPNPLRSGVVGLAVASIAPILNPYGWRLYTVPLSIAHLVGLDHIPNPEWISPSFSDVPPLYVAMAAAVLILAIKERRAARWALLVMISVLAMRYVRNVGLFFALYPIVIAPSLAATSLMGIKGAAARTPLGRIAAAALSVLIVASMVAAPGRQPGWRLSENFYPDNAWDFIQRSGLDTTPIYNDVRFGGFLIRRHYPERRTFIDDRNEIHEPLLADIHSILKSSDPGAWQAMLDRWGARTALVRYNPPFRVVRPDGTTIGSRGFSALWFPSQRWALVYWDDIAMVLVDRNMADPGLVARHEYRIIRPDDVDELRHRVAADPALRQAAAAELARKLEEQPDSDRALALSQIVLGIHP